MLRFILLMLVTVSAHAEFYIWHDEDGVKHVSTHPRECIKNGVVSISCPPIGSGGPSMPTQIGEQVNVEPKTDREITMENRAEEKQKIIDDISQLENMVTRFRDQTKLNPNDIGAKEMLKKFSAELSAARIKRDSM